MADHIHINREDTSGLYARFRRNTNPPRPQPRDRSQHGAALKEELTEAFNSIAATRQRAGIETDNLFVIEILSDAIAPNILDRMLGSFNIWLVEEVAIHNTNHSRLVVQFADRSAIDAFERERALWQSDDPSNGILTYPQRRDLFSCIAAIRQVSREDRMGPRLTRMVSEGKPWPEGMVAVNIDVWYNGDSVSILEMERQIRTALGTQGSRLLGDLFKLPSMLLGRALVNEFTLNVLLDMDIVAMVDLPMEAMSTEQCALYTSDIQPIVENALDENAPLAAVLDSGVFSGNPLLSSLIVGEEDFDLTESTSTDLNGHGTGVTGIVAYGGFSGHDGAAPVFKPLVRIYNGKIMHNVNGDTDFAQDKRPEQIMKEAIEYFHEQYHCRVFNLSCGNSDYIYSGGRQMPWAELIDQLVRELDIVVVVSAGNVSYPEIPDFSSREELMAQCRDQLFSPVHRLIDPATTALGITVGSITRYSDPGEARHAITRVSAGERDYPSVFTRVGEGVGGAVKPDFVDYGGNYALHQISRGDHSWQRNDRALMEPTLNHTLDRVFKGYIGTSFAAPHVTHVAARLERALEQQMGEAPSANLIRALLSTSAKYSSAMREWTEGATDPYFTGRKAKRQAQRLRLVGYGKVDDSVLLSGEKQVTLFAEDGLDLRSFHLYRIPVPGDFLGVKGKKRIAVGLAYDPPTRLSRKSYLANNLWVEIFRRLDEDLLRQYVEKKSADEEDLVEEIEKTFRAKHDAGFQPGGYTLRNSTLQQRVWEKSPTGGTNFTGDEPYIYILVTGKEKFSHPESQMPQRYALAITFSYEADADIALYQQLHDGVRIKSRERVRERTQIQL